MRPKSSPIHARAADLPPRGAAARRDQPRAAARAGLGADAIKHRLANRTADFRPGEGCTHSGSRPPHSRAPLGRGAPRVRSRCCPQPPLGRGSAGSCGPSIPWSSTYRCLAAVRAARDGIRVHRPRRLDPEDCDRPPVHSRDHRAPHPHRPGRGAFHPRARARPRRSRVPEAARPGRRVRGRTGRDIAAATEPHRLAKLLRRHEPGSTRTTTPLEEDFYLLVTTAGLPRPEVNQTLARTPSTSSGERASWWSKPTAAPPTTADRSAKGRSPRRLARRPRLRDARFTWHQVHHRQAEVLAALRAKLA